MKHSTSLELDRLQDTSWLMDTCLAVAKDGKAACRIHDKLLFVFASPDLDRPSNAPKRGQGGRLVKLFPSVAVVAH